MEESFGTKTNLISAFLLALYSCIGKVDAYFGDDFLVERVEYKHLFIYTLLKKK